MTSIPDFQSRKRTYIHRVQWRKTRMHREAKKSASCKGSRAQTSANHSGTKREHPQVYISHGVDLLRKLNFRRSNPSDQLHFKMYGLLCMLGSIFCSSPAQQCLSSSWVFGLGYFLVDLGMRVWDIRVWVELMNYSRSDMLWKWQWHISNKLIDSVAMIGSLHLYFCIVRRGKKRRL